MNDKLRNNNDNIKVFVNSLKACRAAFNYSLLFSFISNLMMLMVPMYSLQVLDRVISSGSIETLLMLTIVVSIAIVCLTLVQLIRSSLLSRLANWLDSKLSPLLFAHSVASAASFKSAAPCNQNLSDLASIKNFITGPALSALLDAPWSVIFITVLFFIHPTLGVIAIISGLFLVGMAVLNELKTKPIFDMASEHSIKTSHYADMAIRNAEAVEAMGMMNNILSAWQGAGNKVALLQKEAGRRASMIGGVTRFFRQMVQIAVTGVGAYYVLQHEMTVGAMIAAGIIVGRALAPFENAITSWKGFVTARKSLSRLMQSLQNAPQRASSLELPPPIGNVSVENIYFSPHGVTRPIIKGISFALGAGESLAIIGPSAAGKSTLAKLLTGVLKPASGAVRLDSADIYNWPRASFGRYVGYLPQDVELFAGTVKENIARMDVNAKDEDVIMAAQIANVHDLILRLPQAYETEIGVAGASLSAGQKQRIALARTFYGEPKFIVLDEPNANLDNEGDIALAGAISNAKKSGITVVVISHRPALVQLVDNILVMNDGTITKFGKCDEVLASMEVAGKKANLKVIK